MTDTMIKGTPMAVCCTSKKVVKAISMYLNRVRGECRVPDREIIELVGDTAKETKHNIIYSLDKIVKNNNILVYNTVITVGTSTTERCDVVFCVDTNQDVIPQVVHQMTQRFRTATEFYCSINKKSPRYLPVSRLAYRQYIKEY